jgi:hypothetical protein
VVFGPGGVEGGFGGILRGRGVFWVVEGFPREGRLAVVGG